MERPLARSPRQIAQAASYLPYPEKGSRIAVGRPNMAKNSLAMPLVGGYQVGDSHVVPYIGVGYW
ncbi:hypothetical protein CCHOA_06790 [Corynebacterium choanae]|uniref:Uncharacterized protein n=1 Tax=Corynebacterium choanae TaxID=1862358 RepID=A0A3G6JB33_9CORY|nr:hypothetical protein CCHOA_06790 [Corynebacterium choanae]